MRICIIGYDFSRNGGIEEVSLQLVNILRRNGIKHDVIKYNKFSKYILIVLQYVYRYININTIYIFMHPYIFNNHSSFKNSIVWTYGIDVWGDYGKKMTNNLPKAKKVISISEFTTNQLKNNHNNIDISTISLSVRQSKDANRNYVRRRNGKITLITVARLSSNEKYKGHDLTIRALKKIKDEHNLKINYNIVGKGDDTKRLKALTVELQIEDQVKFFGYVHDDQISSMYYNSHVFVMPSRVVKSDSQMWGGEGFGLVYLEAGLHKLPVIACDEGGQVDCIVDGYTGFLIKPEVSVLADKLLQLHNDSNMREKMGENGYKHVTENFSFEKFEHEVLEAINSLPSD